MKTKTVLSLIAKVVLVLVMPVIAIGVLPKSAKSSDEKAPALSDYIRPFVGTYGEGNCYPGPTAPFGMVQLSPDTDKMLWETASGYEYSDPSILGFSLTHLSGTGIPDLGDFLFVPQIGKPEYDSGTKENPNSGYRSAFSHDNETAAAGYYQVMLQKNGVNVELAAADRAGIMRMTFPESDEASIMIDLNHLLTGGQWKVTWSHVRVENENTVTGFHVVRGWGPERYLYFAAKFSRPFDSFEIISDGKPVIYDSYKNYRFRSRTTAAGTNLRFVAKYKTKKDEAILVKVGVSPVGATGAMKNLDAEIPGWDFEKVRKDTCAKWDRELSRIEIDGTREEKETFYTAMYHSFTTPNLYEDVTKEYRGFDGEVHRAEGYTNYAVFSLWDTFRAEHPLFALIQAERDSDMINSLLAHYDQSTDHLLPMWALPGNETWCMIGYHAVPVIVDGYLKGVKGFNPERAYKAVRDTAMTPDYDGVADYAKLGWVPFDKENESVSKTLEYAYDDYCVARMAQALHKAADVALFMKRAASYKNLYDSSTGFMRGKDSAGKWREKFDPHGYEGGDFTEATSWQYSWFAPQDVPGLIALFGGKEKFTEKLDTLFNFKTGNDVGADDIQGRIGEYWHGNEPSHHIIYLYSLAGQPWKAAERLHQVMRTQYGNQPKSLSGNDDCGQMSAWYIFTALGFYPVCPGSDYYVIGSPTLKKAVVHLSNGKTFTTVAENVSPENIYIQSIKLNGKDWNQPILPFSELKDGGTIVYTMGPKPNEQWGTEAKIPE
jgi:predicted alpha-1,2-mannosidase